MGDSCKCSIVVVSALSGRSAVLGCCLLPAAGCFYIRSVNCDEVLASFFEINSTIRYLNSFTQIKALNFRM